MVRFEEFFGSHMCGINSHLLLHLPEQIHWWGSLRETWLYPFERVNGEMVSQTLNSRHRTRKHPEKAMCRKILPMMVLRSAAMADDDVNDAMNSVYPPDGAQLDRRVLNIVLPDHVMRALRSLLRQQDNTALHGIQGLQRCQLGSLLLCTNITERVNDARVRFKPDFTACRYAQIEQLLFVPLAEAQNKSGFVAVVHFYTVDPFIRREGTGSNRYRKLTGGDIIMDLSERWATALADSICVFVEDIECKVAFVEVEGLAATGRRWAVLDGPPAG